MAPFGLSLDGETIAHISSDGIVVATPTGSTAYFLSAGGPIIAPTVDAFGVAALLPHTLFARPLIVPTSSTIQITCDSEIVHANLETDGTFVSDLSSGDLVTVVRAPRPVKFARTGDHGVLRPARRQAAMGRSDQTRMNSVAAAPDDRQRRLDRARAGRVRRRVHGLHRRDGLRQDDAARRAGRRARRTGRTRTDSRRSPARRARDRRRTTRCARCW